MLFRNGIRFTQVQRARVISGLEPSAFWQTATQSADASRILRLCEAALRARFDPARAIPGRPGSPGRARHALTAFFVATTVDWAACRSEPTAPSLRRSKSANAYGCNVTSRPA